MYSWSFHEKRAHGTMEFPVDYYYIDKDHPRYHMPFHWHKEWEIIRILEGKLLLHANEEEYSARAGDVFLLRDGMLHGGTPENCVYECLVFDLHGLFRNVEAAKRHLRPVYNGLILPRVCYPSFQEDVYPIVEELLEAFHTGLNRVDLRCAALTASSGQNVGRDLSELFALGDISRLFAVILQKGYFNRPSHPQPGTSRKVERLKTVLEYVETHFSSRLSLEELAEVSSMSPKYFSRFFHSITQQTPMDYVNFYRIERAANLLCSTELSVTAVGAECGFSDSSYFVKIFKKYKGMTPGTYRKCN